LFLALGLAIVTEAFPPNERGRALGLAGSIVSIGIVVGPTLGGILLENFSWHWIFMVNLPVGILGFLMVLRYLPATRPPGGQRFDIAGALLLCVTLVTLLLGMTSGQRQGFTDPQTLLLFVVSAVTLLLFLLVERRHSQPLIDLQLFRNRLFTVNMATGLIIFISLSGTLILMPFYLENVLGYGVRQVGFLLAAVPIGLGVTAPVSGALADRYGTRPISIVGLLILVIAVWLLSTLAVDTSAAGFMLRFLPLGIGMGMFQSPNNSAIMGSAPRERYGVASGLLAVTRTLGQIIGISVLGSVWAARVFTYHGAAMAEGATAAPPAAQVSGLHDTFLIMAGTIILALLLALWTWRQERRLESEPEPGKERPIILE
jgi:EmrB/QacA subfamily drug resistance transporter